MYTFHTFTSALGKKFQIYILCIDCCLSEGLKTSDFWNKILFTSKCWTYLHKYGEEYHFKTLLGPLAHLTMHPCASRLILSLVLFYVSLFRMFKYLITVHQTPCWTKCKNTSLCLLSDIVSLELKSRMQITDGRLGNKHSYHIKLLNIETSNQKPLWFHTTAEGRCKNDSRHVFKRNSFKQP